MWWGKEIILGFEAGNRHMEAAGGSSAASHLLDGFLTLPHFQFLRCNLSAMGLQVVAPG